MAPIEKTVKTSFSILTWEDQPPKTDLQLGLKVRILTSERKLDHKDWNGFIFSHCIKTFLHSSDKNSHMDGQQIFEGLLFDKKGAFALGSHGDSEGPVSHGTWKILPETATGELVGITGHGKYRIDASKDLENPEVSCELTVCFPQ